DNQVALAAGGIEIAKAERSGASGLLSVRSGVFSGLTTSDMAAATGFTVGSHSGFFSTAMLLVRAGAGAQFRMGRVNGSLDSPQAVSSGDTLLQFDARGHTGSGFEVAGTFNFRTTENWSPTSRGA